jgi:hypothetical protein
LRIVRRLATKSARAVALAETSRGEGRGKREEGTELERTAER